MNEFQTVDARPTAGVPAPHDALSRRRLLAFRLGRGPGADHWIRVFRRAMACRFEITLSGEDARQVHIAREALDEADRLEAALTVFNDASDLMQVNRYAATGPVAVDAELFALLDRCRTLHAETDGAFDITSTPLSRCWGFLARDGHLPAADALEAARAVVGMAHVTLDRVAAKSPSPSPPAPSPSPDESGRERARGYVRRAADVAPAAGASHADGVAHAGAGYVAFDRTGVALNLGSIGKGYAVQQIGLRLRAQGVRHALVSAASSSILAIGGRGHGWCIDLHSRLATRGPLARVFVRNGAVGTSGAGEQFVEIDGRRYGHVIDPRTGWPAAAGMLSASVVTRDAATADALATAFFVGGIDLARRYCDTHPDTLALLTPDDGSERPQIVGRYPGALVEAL